MMRGRNGDVANELRVAAATTMVMMTTTLAHNGHDAQNDADGMISALGCCSADTI